jgi:hypothetical protein
MGMLESTEEVTGNVARSDTSKLDVNNSSTGRVGWFEGAKFYIPLLVAYLYASGRLYFDAYMDRLGFSGAGLDGVLSPVSYAVIAFSSFAESFIKIDYWEYALSIVSPSLFIACSLSVLIISVRCRLLTKVKEWLQSKAGREREGRSSKTDIDSFISKYWVALSVATFPAALLFYFCVLFLVTVASVLALLPFAIPILAGVNDANEYLLGKAGNVCVELDWSSKEYSGKNVVLGCENIFVVKGEDTITLKGKTLHVDSGFIYFSTNNALYRISKNRDVITKSLKQRREDKSD